MNHWDKAKEFVTEMMRQYCEEDARLTNEYYEAINNPLKKAPMNSRLINGQIITIDQFIGE